MAGNAIVVAPTEDAKFETFPITGSQELVFAGKPALPDRTDRMYDPLRGQVESRCEPCPTGRAAPDLAGGLQETGACGAVNRAIDRTTAEE